jgi:hypothetical protein
MTLEEFAKNAGVYLVPCKKDWGGEIAYRTKDHPHCSIAGFRTEQAAYKHWLAETFGRNVAKAVLKLLQGATP